jgi:hypothetical protein
LAPPLCASIVCVREQKSFKKVREQKEENKKQIKFILNTTFEAPLISFQKVAGDGQVASGFSSFPDPVALETCSEPEL